MRELVPILALSIPVIVVLGKFIIEPLAGAILKAVRDPERLNVAPIAQRLADTEERLDRIEQSLTRLVEEQDFKRDLLTSKGSSGAGVERT